MVTDAETQHVFNEYLSYIQSKGLTQRVFMTKQNCDVLDMWLADFKNKFQRLPSGSEMYGAIIVLAEQRAIMLAPDPDAPVPAAPAAQAATVAETDTMPFADDNNLRNITTLEDINEMSVEKVKRFAVPGTELNKRFEARVTWIRDNKVRRPKVEEAEPTPLTLQERLKNESYEQWKSLNARINSVGGNRGYLKTVINFRERLHEDLKSMIAEGKPFAECERFILREIKSREEGSVR